MTSFFTSFSSLYQQSYFRYLLESHIHFVTYISHIYQISSLTTVLLKTINSVTSPSFNSSIVSCSVKCKEFFNNTISEILQFISPDLHECLSHPSHSNQVVVSIAQSLLWFRSQKKYGSMQMQIFTQFEIFLDLS